MNELEKKALQAERERINDRRREAYKADQERIEALEAQVRDLLSIIPAEELVRLESERNRATLRIERLEEALRFYADLNNYRKDDLGYTKVGGDLGDIARSVLELESEDSE